MFSTSSNGTCGAEYAPVTSLLPSEHMLQRRAGIGAVRGREKGSRQRREEGRGDSRPIATNGGKKMGLTRWFVQTSSHEGLLTTNFPVSEGIG